MRRFVQRLFKSSNLLIVLVLLAANGLAWARALEPAGPVCTAEPVLEPSLAGLRTRLREGGHGGERFELAVTGQEAAESIAWFISIHPEIPFRNPCIAFDPAGLDAVGEAHLLGLRLSIEGRATMGLGDGIPVVTLTGLDVAGAPVPGFILAAVQDAVYEQVDLSDQDLPVVFETLELREGEAVASGVIR